MNPYEEARTDALAFLLLQTARGIRGAPTPLPNYDFLVRGMRFDFRARGRSIEFDLLGVVLDARGAIDQIDVFEVKVEGKCELQRQISDRIESRVFRRVWAAFVINKGEIEPSLPCGVLELPGKKREGTVRGVQVRRFAPLLAVGDSHDWARALRDKLPRLAQAQRVIGRPCVFLRCPACNREVSNYYAFEWSMAVKYPMTNESTIEHAFFCPTRNPSGQRFFGGATYFWKFVDGAWVESQIAHSASGILPQESAAAMPSPS